MTWGHVLVADDHPLWAEGLAAMLRAAGASSVRIVSELELVGGALQESPEADLLILDMSFGRQSALGRIASLHSVSPTTRIMVLTAHASRSMAHEAIRSGASAYAVKTLPPQEIAGLVQRVATAPEGDLPITSLGDRQGRALRAAGVFAGAGLSMMQLRVLRAVASTASQGEAAAQLGITRKGVEYHLKQVRGKTGIVGTPELVSWAREAGYLDADDS